MKQIDTPIELRIALKPNARNPSGYDWTSPGGPPQAVQAGTLCTTLITVRQQAPITFVIPMLREGTGL
jgi:HlyD family secretion protein